MLTKADFEYMYDTNKILKEYFNEEENSYKVFTRLIEEIGELVIEILNGNKKNILEESEDVIRGCLQLISYYGVEKDFSKNFLDKDFLKTIKKENIMKEFIINSGELAKLINHQEKSGVKTIKEGEPYIFNIIYKLIDIINLILNVLLIEGIKDSFSEYIFKINQEVRKDHLIN